MNPIKIDPEIMGGTPCFAGTVQPGQVRLCLNPLP